MRLSDIPQEVLFEGSLKQTLAKKIKHPMMDQRLANAKRKLKRDEARWVKTGDPDDENTVRIQRMIVQKLRQRLNDAK